MKKKRREETATYRAEPQEAKKRCALVVGDAAVRKSSSMATAVEVFGE